MYFENMPVVKLLFHILLHGEESYRNVLTQSAFPFYFFLGTYMGIKFEVAFIHCDEKGRSNGCSHFSRKKNGI